MREHFELAIKNVTEHGDTDIFPYPIENRIFHDERESVLDLLEQYHANFDEYLVQFPPAHISALIPVSYTGFRWATQLDPIWNLYFLGCVLSIAQEIENTRLPAADQKIFSYRFDPNQETGSLFANDIGWPRFIEKSIELARRHTHVVVSDISEFYPRLGHHRLDAALVQLNQANDVAARIRKILSHFSGTRSFGLPIGGPAARILSELVLNQIDHLLSGRGVNFVRFADDYHIFANSHEEGYANLIYLSEKLSENQGLSLQKSKTRILPSAEFLATSPIRVDPPQEGAADGNPEDDPARQQAQQFMRFSLRFDPYSPTAAEDYENLRQELDKFDIVGMLAAELGKSQIHAALSRRILRAVRFLDDQPRDDAIISVVNNTDLLFPIFSSVALVIFESFDHLGADARREIIEKISQQIERESHVFRVDMHLAFAVRILSKDHSARTSQLLQGLYERRTSPMIRRDIILTMAHWREWYWLSDLRNRFRELSGTEKRAFIVASYTLREEGPHWRQHIRREFSPFEILVRDWASHRVQENPDWRVPV